MLDLFLEETCEEEEMPASKSMHNVEAHLDRQDFISAFGTCKT